MRWDSIQNYWDSNSNILQFEVMPVSGNKEKEFLNYIHYSRGLAIMAIVARHLIFPLEETNPGLYDFLLLITGNSSILFVFISGFLFEYLLPKYNYKQYLSKKVRFVILPYLIFSIPALILYAFDLPWAQFNLESEIAGFGDYSLFHRLVMLLITGAHQWHFWFIPMITLIYLSAPILKFVDRNPLLYMVLPILIGVAVFMGRPTFAPLRSYLYFLPVYMMGMLASRYRGVMFEAMNKYKGIIWILFLFLILTSWTYLRFRNFEWLYFQKIIGAFVLLKVMKEVSSKTVKWALSLLAKYSFTIYFIHMYVHIFLRHLSITIGAYEKPDLLVFTVLVTLNLLISIFLAHLAKYFLGSRSKSLLGV